MAEPLTIAYIAMGAQRRMQVAVRGTESEAQQKLIDCMSGELAVIDHVIAFADKLDLLQDSIGNDSYVYAYEVCEEFGYYAVDRMLKTGTPNTVDLEEIARFIIIDVARD